VKRARTSARKDHPKATRLEPGGRDSALKSQSLAFQQNPFRNAADQVPLSYSPIANPVNFDSLSENSHQNLWLTTNLDYPGDEWPGWFARGVTLDIAGLDTESVNPQQDSLGAVPATSETEWLGRGIGLEYDLFGTGNADGTVQTESLPELQPLSYGTDQEGRTVSTRDLSGTESVYKEPPLDS
jgi:hypothetical protein